jgi:hypothetical protein
MRRDARGCLGNMSADEIPHKYGGAFRRRSVTKKADACVGGRTRVMLMLMHGTVAWLCTRNAPPPPRANFQSKGVVFGGVRLTRRQCVIRAAATTTTSTGGWGVWWVIVGVRGGTTPVGIYLPQLLRGGGDNLLGSSTHLAVSPLR